MTTTKNVYEGTVTDISYMPSRVALNVELWQTEGGYANLWLPCKTEEEARKWVTHYRSNNKWVMRCENDVITSSEAISWNTLCQIV